MPDNCTFACTFENHKVKPVHSIHHLSDNDLVHQYRQRGDMEVLGVLFKRYTHLVYGVCLKYLRDEDDSKDAVMQIFEKLISDLKKYQVEHFKAWLHTIAKNHCLMILRKTKRQYYQSLSEENETLDIVESSFLLHQVDTDKEHQLSLMEKGMLTLNTEQKKCVELFYLKEMSYQEVADATGYSLLQVKSYIQNGKRNLKIFMEKNHDR